MMQNWKSQVNRKKHFANSGNNQKKGKNCQTDDKKKFFFCNPKAYKHKDYNKWHKLAYTMNKQPMPNGT